MLLRLFETSREFNMQIQPQLVLLQKTLLNIEGLGRQLDPDLDLWKTAKPYLERWMSEQIGLRGFIKNVRKEAPNWATILPQLPRLTFDALTSLDVKPLAESLHTATRHLAWQNRLLALVAALLGVIALALWLKF